VAAELAPVSTPPPRPRAAPPPDARLRLCVLGSGSGGNCSVVRCGSSNMLIDAGFGPLTTARRLNQAGLRAADLHAICLTHLDQDHFRPTWIPTIIGLKIRVFLHRWHVEDLPALPKGQDLLDSGLVVPFDDSPFTPADGFDVHPIRLSHDVKGTSGFRVRTAGGTLGYATDLGHVPDALIGHFAGVDLLALECNYDRQMQIGSDRPWFLKRRIMGTAGHLSNEQAFEAVQQIVQRSPAGNPQHIVLLHRSQQCNCPDKVRALFHQHESIKRRLTLTEQRRRSRWLTAAPPCATVGAQLSLGF
jgi:phosphoribosyl 1,2-cyclic phosphodiesterase